MTKPLSDYSQTERAKIAILARRILPSEISLILGEGFAVIMIILFFFGEYTVLPIAAAFMLRPTVVWIVLSASLTIFWALTHARRTGPRIIAARDLHAAFLHEHEAQIQTYHRRRATKGT